ncbi:hypothetical protein [Lysobacter sp. HA35]
MTSIPTQLAAADKARNRTIALKARTSFKDPSAAIENCWPTQAAKPNQIESQKITTVPTDISAETESSNSAGGMMSHHAAGIQSWISGLNVRVRFDLEVNDMIGRASEGLMAANT